MSISKENTRTMITMSLKLKQELDKKSDRDNDNLNTVLLKAVLQYIKKDPEINSEVVKDLKTKIKKLELKKKEKMNLTCKQ